MAQLSRLCPELYNGREKDPRTLLAIPCTIFMIVQVAARAEAEKGLRKVLLSIALIVFGRTLQLERRSSTAVATIKESTSTKSIDIVFVEVEHGPVLGRLIMRSTSTLHSRCWTRYSDAGGSSFILTVEEHGFRVLVRQLKLTRAHVKKHQRSLDIRLHSLDLPCWFRLTKVAP